MPYSKRILFWTINVGVAIVLFALTCVFVLRRLDAYTRHGHYILVPDLRGITPREALPVVTGQDLHVVVVDSVYNKEVAGGVIVEQYPRPDAKVKNNRVIQLTVNARSPEMVLFPDLRQSPYRQALQKLKNMRLRPGRIEYAPSPYANLVLGFRRDGLPVEAGTMIPVGTRIDILLGEGQKPVEATVPRLAGKTLEEAREALLHAYLNPGEAIGDRTVANEADRATARVYDQRPREGELARAGATVTLYLSKIARKVVVEVDSTPPVEAGQQEAE
jgi:beta-lactam-binding protein with PASTA domain